MAQCGQAGENLVPYACVVNELKHVSGRTGMGAVMGSKKPSGRCRSRVPGKSPRPIPEKVREITRRAVERISESPLGNQLKRFGTPVFVMGLQNGGILPTRNFQEGRFEGAQAISGETMTETILQGPERVLQLSRPVQAEREGGGEIQGHARVWRTGI